MTLWFHDSIQNSIRNSIRNCSVCLSVLWFVQCSLKKQGCGRREKGNLWWRAGQGMPPWTKRGSPWLDEGSKTRSNAGLKHVHAAFGQTGPELPFVLISSPPCLSRSVASVPISIMVLPKHRSICHPSRIWGWSCGSDVKDAERIPQTVAAGWEGETLTLLSLVKEIRVMGRARQEIAALFPWENVKSALSFEKSGFSV